MSTVAETRQSALRGIDIRAAAGVAMFWFSSLAVGCATFLALALLSPHLPAGGLAAVSAVLGLSYVLAVPPGAIQLRATAAAGRPGPDLTLRPPRLVMALAAGLLVVSPALAHVLKLPVTAVALAAFQLPLASALGSARGSFIGEQQLGRASASFGIDASCRLLAGVLLGLAWGATGVAAALVLASALPLAALRPPAGRPRAAAVAGSSAAYILAVSVLAVVINADVLLSRRVLGPGADHYAAAALPSKGIYFALFALSWVAVASTLRTTSRLRLLAPVAATFAVGLVGAAVLVAARPLLPALLRHGEPALSVLGPLALAMAVAGVTSTVVSMAVARGARRPWAAALLAVLALSAVAMALRPDQAQLADAVLLAQLLALGGGLYALLKSPAGTATGDADAADGAGATAPAAVADATPGRLRLAQAVCSRRSPTATVSPGAPPAADPPTRLSNLLLAGACLIITAACFGVAPGHILADTKLDLFVAPGRFLTRSLNLWDASSAFGQVQNQAVGYLFPMGPFFAGAAGIGVPMWIAQRVWLAVLVSCAVWGTTRVAGALRIGSPTGCVLAGLIYGLSPFIVGQLASTSAGVIPAALAPWALLPLIRASRAGSPRRAAGRSGVAVFAMGAVNAAGTLGVLLLPALYLLTRQRSRARRALILWWLGAVALACTWWAVALVFQGHSGLNFVRFTETSATTQATTSALEVLRGTPDWLSYLHLGQAWVPAGWSLATTPLAILATAGLAAAGAAGLACRRLPERTFLVGAFAVGVLCVGAGYAGPASGVAGPAVQSLLGGALAAFRNTDKFEPVVTLPLALGTVYLLGRLTRARVRWAASAGVLALALTVPVLPLWQGNLAGRGSFQSVPAYWYRLADWMSTQAAASRTLLMPASGFGEYDWGRPMDEPLEPLATTTWAVRNLLPLGGIASTQLLDAIEAEVVDDQVSPHLGEVLSRAGIAYVVARNDLDWQQTDSPSPARVVAALRAGGLRPVAAFGAARASESGLASLELPKAQRQVPSLEVFAVPGGASLVQAYPQAGAVALSGGPESLPQLAERGQLGSRAVVQAVDVPQGASIPEERWIVSDASRRQGLDFGLAHSNFSYTLQPNERAPGNPNLQVAPATPGAEQAVAVYRGDIASVTASSYGSWLLQLPELAPSNAFDGDPATAWAPGTVGTSAGQWVQANLTKPVSLSHIGVRLLEDGPWRPIVRRITVTTRTGSLTTAVRPDQSVQTVPAPMGPTSFVRVTLASVTGQTRGGATAGLRDVIVPGVSATRYVQPPEESALSSSAAAAGVTPTFDFTRQTADPQNLLRRDPETQLARVIQLPAAARMKITGTVLPTPGTALDRLLTHSRGIQVSASSSWDQLPNFRPGNAVDGSTQTAWVAAPWSALPSASPSAPGVAGPAEVNQGQRVSPVPAAADPHPSLSLRWSGARTLASVRVAPAGGLAAPPTLLRISSRQGSRTVPVAPNGGLARFQPLRTDRITVTFPAVAVRYTNTQSGTRVRLPVGVAELDFPALRSLAVIPIPPGRKLDLPCGQGPPVTVDGHKLATRVSTTAGAVSAPDAIPFSVCTPNQSVALSAGTHWVLSPSGAFTISQMTVAPTAEVAGSAPPARAASVLRRGPDAREVRLGAGPASYLAVRENFNTGWQATLNGRRLAPVRLEGWEQGFGVPAGAAGVVRLTYGPNHAFQIGLLVGAGLVLGLLALTVLPARRRWQDAETVARPAVVAGRWSLLLTAAAIVVAVALLSWPALIGLAPLAWMARRRRELLPAAAGLALLAAGILVAVHVVPYPPEHHGTFGAIAQTLAGIAFAAVLAAQLSVPGRAKLRQTTSEQSS
ncbi:MAG: DUF3367 domain-containing protein [Solirubrobacterales bacterium]|nr:DUF3367 domain-containing protein [Solirubrobacterales bacterium]